MLVISNHIKQSQQEISESESENLPSTASELLLNSLYNVQVSARNWVAREQEDRNEHFIKLQWKLIAQVFDRLLMIFFTFICAGCGLAFKLRVRNPDLPFLGHPIGTKDITNKVGSIRSFRI